MSSRSLLLPGPQPPLAHFGATLLRHVVTTGLRYALHSLGAPMPERAPVRIVRLRLYLDREKLEAALGDAPSTGALAGALLEPGGRGVVPAGAGALRGAAAFHRWRLRLRLARRARMPRQPGPDAAAADLWRHLRATISGLQPALGDALLGELLAALARRAARARGRRIAPAVGRQAFAVLAGQNPDLASLGVADPLVGPWSESPGVTEHVARRLGEGPAIRTPRRAHPLRGEFREAYRRALNPIRAAYLRLASDARRHGLIEEIGDAFFIPFDLAENLAADRPPAWLPQAVSANRAEYQSLADAASPAESIGRGAEPRTVDDRGDWMLAPLWPLE